MQPGQISSLPGQISLQLKLANIDKHAMRSSQSQIQASLPYTLSKLVKRTNCILLRFYNMRVNRRRIDALVPQQGLNSPEVNTTL